jgi:hypothetical protein
VEFELVSLRKIAIAPVAKVTTRRRKDLFFEPYLTLQVFGSL